MCQSPCAECRPQSSAAFKQSLWCHLALMLPSNSSHPGSLGARGSLGAPGGKDPGDADGLALQAPIMLLPHAMIESVWAFSKIHKLLSLAGLFPSLLQYVLLLLGRVVRSLTIIMTSEIWLDSDFSMLSASILYGLAGLRTHSLILRTDGPGVFRALLWWGQCLARFTWPTTSYRMSVYSAAQPAK